MNSLLKTILDGLTYKDLAGRRQLRAHTALSLLILFLLILVGGFALASRMRWMSGVEAAPLPVTMPPVPEITPTSAPQSITIPEPGCPTDPEQWSLTETVIPQNYKIIQPACVYAGLEKTIAWALAIRQGYSRTEATEQLGFSDMPMRQIKSVTIPAGTNGLMDVPVGFIPPHPDFREWHVNMRGESSTTYALRGCFRTSSIHGNRLETWGGDYSVICVVIEDAENTHVVYQLGGHVYTSPAVPMRSFLLFGYAGDDLWTWLGTQSDPRIEIDNPAEFANDRLTIAALYDSRPWDMKWLKMCHGLEMQDLPEGWPTQNEEGEKQAILAGINNHVEGKIP